MVSSTFVRYVVFRVFEKDLVNVGACVLDQLVV